MSIVSDFNSTLRKSPNLSFILGNGINRYAYTNNDAKFAAIPWYSLVQYLWNTYSKNKYDINEHDNGISLTELYDVIHLNEGNAPTLTMKESVIEYFSNNNINEQEEYHKELQKALAKWNVPVLTTNFDSNLDRNLKKTILRDPQLSPSSGFTHYYPWNVVYSIDPDAIFSNHLSNYGVWHINGMLDYMQSIRLGLTDYMGQVERARRMINSMKKGGDTPFTKANMDKWEGYYTWLYILFNTDICIIGLNLDVNENFLRWLLIERQKYYKRFEDRDIIKCNGWYVYSKDDKELTIGKRLFLESVGLTLVQLNTYKEIYEDLLLKVPDKLV